MVGWLVEDTRVLIIRERCREYNYNMLFCDLIRMYVLCTRIDMDIISCASC